MTALDDEADAVRESETASCAKLWVVLIAVMVTNPVNGVFGQSLEMPVDRVVVHDGGPSSAAESERLAVEPDVPLDASMMQPSWPSLTEQDATLGNPAESVSYPFRPAWDLAVDALMLWQGNSQSLPLFLDSSGGTALNTQDLQTETGAGVRVGGIRAVGERHAIEGVYFQARPFNAEDTAPAAGGPYELTNAGDLAFTDIAEASVSSNGWIQSAEINWRKNECWSPITWLVGFRWVELNSRTNVDYVFANPDPFGVGSINTAAGNNLYGAQFGIDTRLWNAWGRWRVNCSGKAGAFYNSASFQRTSAGLVLEDGTPFPLGTVAATADQTSFFGELGMNSTYWVTDWLAWRLGYVVMWAAGVAVAADQLPLNNFGDATAAINTNGSVLLHGVTTGLEARW